MTTRCMIRKILPSLSAALALVVWPSFSMADTVNVVNWNASTTGLNMPGGSFNLTNNALIIQADNTADAQAAYAYAYNQLKSGYNFGAWTGNSGPSDATGVYSDSTNFNTNSSSFPSAATDVNNGLGITALGIELNDGNDANIGGNDTAYKSWDGVAVNSYSVLVKYTYYGDTDLDGIVEGYDVNNALGAFLADQGPGNSGNATGLANGESDFAGTVTNSDVNNVLGAFLAQSSDASLGFTVTPSHPVFMGEAAVSPVGVPEPGSLVLALFGVIGVVASCRRRFLVRG